MTGENMQEYTIFTNIGESLSKVTMQASIWNTWILEETWKLHDMHVELLHDPVRVLAELCHIGLWIIIKGDHPGFYLEHVDLGGNMETP